MEKCRVPQSGTPEFLFLILTVSIICQCFRNRRHHVPNQEGRKPPRPETARRAGQEAVRPCHRRLSHAPRRRDWPEPPGFPPDIRHQSRPPSSSARSSPQGRTCPIRDRRIPSVFPGLFRYVPRDVPSVRSRMTPPNGDRARHHLPWRVSGASLPERFFLP